MADTIHCPSCQTEIKLTDQLAAPLVKATQEKFEKLIRDSEFEHAARLKAERARITVEAEETAKLHLHDELAHQAKEIASLQALASERAAKLEAAQKAQADIVRQQRELEDQKREMALTIETRVSEGMEAIRARAQIEAEDRLSLTITERDRQIQGMMKQIEELKRRAEQGSQQGQGEALEVQLEGLLSSKFPFDVIEPVPKGEFGGDVVHRVLSGSGKPCGIILWETKRTKNWGNDWLAKLRDDKRTAKADVTVLVSETLPKGIETFDHLEGVWVTSRRCAIPVGVALRQGLIEVAQARQFQEGQQDKKELVYDYLTGPRFRQRIEAIVERFSEMQDDLNKERKATMRSWAKREMQIQGVLDATVGMYGDLQGIAGQAMQEIPALEMPANDP